MVSRVFLFCLMLLWGLQMQAQIPKGQYNIVDGPTAADTPVTFFMNDLVEVSDSDSTYLPAYATETAFTRLFAGGCPATNTFQLQHFGSGAGGITPATLNEPVYAMGTWAGNYVRVNVEDGKRYKISLVGSEDTLRQHFAFPGGVVPNISFNRPQVDHDPMLTLYGSTSTVVGTTLTGNIVGFNEDASATETMPELEYTADYTGQLFVAIDLQPGTIAYSTGHGPPTEVLNPTPSDCSNLFQDSTALAVTWIPAAPAMQSATKDSDTQITLTFDGNVLTNGGNPTDFAVTDGVGTDFAVSAQADGTAGDANIVLTVANLSAAVGDLTVTYTNNNNEIADATDATAFALTGGVTIDIDGSPPTLSSANKDSDTQITVTMSEPVQTNGTNPTDFVVTDALGTTFTVTAQADGTANDTDIVLTVNDMSTAVGDLTVTYANNNNEISDFGGNDLATDGTGVSIDTDNTAPVMVSAAPSGTPLGVNALIFITMSETVQSNGTNPTDFTLVDGLGSNFVVSVQEDGPPNDNIVELTLADLSSAVGDLTITYTNNNNEISDFGGNNLATDATGVTIDADGIAPTLASATKDSDTQITVTLSEAVQSNGTNPTDFTVTDGIGNTYAVSAQADGTAQDTDIVLTVANLSAAVGDLKVTYANNNNEISDFGGNSLATDATGVSIDTDTVAPTLVSGQRNSDTQLTITLSEPIQIIGDTPDDWTVKDANNTPFVVSQVTDGTAQDDKLILTVADFSTATGPLTVTYQFDCSDISDFGGNALQNDLTGIDIQLNPTLSGASLDNATQITVSFSDNVQTNGTNPTDFTVTDGQGTAFTVSTQADGTAGDTDIVLTVPGLSAAVGDLTVTYTNNNNEVSDAAGGTAFVATDAIGVVIDSDTAAPTLSGAQQNSNTTITVTFSEDVQTNATNPTDFAVTDGQGTAFTVTAQADGNANDADIVLTVNDMSTAVGDLTVTYANNNNEISDFGGNDLATDATGVVIDLDSTVPAVSGIVRQDPTSERTNKTTVTFRVTFSELVDNVDVTDFSISGAGAGGTASITGMTTETANTVFDVTVDNINTEGELDLDFDAGQNIADFGGNAFAGTISSEETYTIDNTRPTITSIARNSPTSEITNANSVVFRVTLSEEVSNAGTKDFELSGDAGGGTAAVTAVSTQALSTVIDVTVSTIDTDGELDLDIFAFHTLKDEAGNSFAGTITTEETYTIDTAVPSLLSATKDSDTQITVTLDEIVRTNGTNPADFTVTDGLGNVYTVSNQADGTADDSNIVLTVADLSGAVGDLTVTYANNNSEISDFGGNDLATDATGVVIDSDNTAPTLVSGSKESNTELILTFSEPVQTTGTNPTDFTVVDANNAPFVVSAQADGTANDTNVLLTIADISTAVSPLTVTYANNNNEISDFGGNDMASDATGISIEIPFTIVSASVSAANTIVVSFSQPIQTEGNNPSDFFGIDVTGKRFRVSAVSDVTTGDTDLGLDFKDLSGVVGNLTVFYQNTADVITDAATGNLIAVPGSVVISSFDETGPQLVSGELIGQEEIRLTFNEPVRINGNSFSDLVVSRGNGEVATVNNIYVTAPNSPEITIETEYLGNDDAFGDLKITYVNNGLITDLANNAMESDPQGIEIESDAGFPSFISGQLIDNTTISVRFEEPVQIINSDVSAYKIVAANGDIIQVLSQEVDSQNDDSILLTVEDLSAYTGGMELSYDNNTANVIADFGGQTFVSNNQSSEFQIENTQPELLQIELVDNTQVDLLANEVLRVESPDFVDDDLRLVDGAGKLIPVLSYLDIEERDNTVSLRVKDLSSAIGDVTLLAVNRVSGIQDYGFASLKISQDFTLDLDTDAPVLTSAFAGSDNTVTVEFSESVRTLGGNPTDFSVRDGNGTTFNVLSQEDDRLFDNKVVLTVDPLAAAVGTLTLTYANNNDEITDFGSNSLATDATGVAIEMAPRIISATHDSDMQITLVYNQVVTTKGSNPGDFQAVDASGNTYAVSAQSDGTAGDNLIILTLADMSAAIGGITITYTNNNNEIADAGATVFAADGQIKVERPFIFTWDASVTSNLFLLVNSDLEYNYTVDWGDGNIESSVTGALLHSYNGTDVYTVKVSGDFHGLDQTFGSSNSNFRNGRGGFKDVVQWGSIEWKVMAKMFEQFENMTMSATDAPDLRQITDLSEMFDGASAFNGDIGHWDVSTITDMRSMFNNADAFNQNINSWNVSNVTKMNSMFSYTAVFDQPLDQWDVSAVSNMNGMFRNTEAFNQPIGNWNTSSLTSFNTMFASSVAFNQPLDDWDVSNIRDFGELFEDSEAFNQDLNTWNTSGAEDFEDVFQGTKAFNGDISSWDVSKVFDFSEMFEDAEAFNRDLSSWDMSGATNIEDMFEGALAFNQDLSAWDVSNVTRMDEIFREARAFNQDISAWDVSKATSVDRMFKDAVSFNQDLSAWNFSSSSNLSSFFDSTATSIDNYNAFLISLASQNPGGNSRNLGALGLRYSSEAASARQSLIDAGWTITGDMLVVSLTDGFQSVENQIKLEFSEPIKVSSLNTADFSVTDENDNVYTVTDVTDTDENDEFLSLTVASLEGLSSVLKVAYNNTVDAITDTSGVYVSPVNEVTVGRAFVTTWNIPTGKETFVMPLNDQLIDLYDFTVDWGDGNIQGVAGNNGNFSISGEAVNFTKADNADFNLEANQDRISNDVWITRGNTGGLFNIVTDNSYNTSATSIAWALGSTATADPNGYSADLKQVLGDGIGRTIIGTTLSLHLVNEDRYFDVTVSSWTQGGNGGGFSYTRQEVFSVSEISHEYASTGDYSIAISGDFPAIDLRSSNVADQLSSIDQWGTIAWYEMNGAFTGAINMVYDAFDTPDLENVCSFVETFSGASLLDINLGGWDITNATDFRGMLDGTSLSIDNYDATLVAWAEKSLQNDVRIGVDGLNYCTLGENARQSIIDNHNWVFEGDSKNASCEPVVLTVDVPADGLYGIGGELEFVVTFDQDITITGAPVLPVVIGTSTANAALNGTVANSTEVTFTYTVMEGDLDTDGIALGSLIDLNGGTIQNVRAENAILTLNGIASTLAVLVDGVVPDAPVVVSISDDSGSAADDEITNDNTLSFTGTGEANSIIEVFIDGTSVGTTSADGSGDWTFDYTGIALNDDTYEVTATATDAAGNTGAESSAFSVTVDTTSPAIPTLDLAASTDLGTSSTDNLTSGNSLIFEGTAEPGSVIDIFLVLNGVPSGEGTESTVTGSDGNWQISVMEVLASGDYPLGATATDAAGNSSDISDVLNLIVDQDLAISDISPADNETDVLPNANLTITFDKNVVKGTGSMTIRQVSDDAVIETIEVTGSNVTVSGATVTIDPVDNILPPATEFYVNIDAGAFENEAGAPFAGISDNSTWSFTIIAASVVSSVDVPADGTYMIGDNLDFTVNMILPVSISGTATIPVTIGSSTVNATQVGAVSNTNTILFRYTVVEDELDADGIAVGSAIDLNGGTMRDEFEVDAILTLNGVSSTTAVLVDGVKPSPSITSGAVALVNGTFSATITYDEDVENFTVSDLTIVNGTASNLVNTSAGTTWTVDITPTADGTVDLSLAAGTANDLAGNGSNASNTVSRDFDGTAPVVMSLNRTDSDPVNTGVTEVNYRLIFSEAVTGVDLGDLEVVLTGSATASLNTITAVDASTYDINLNGVGGEGTIGVNVKADDTIIDAATNPLGATFTGQVYTTNFVPTDITLSVENTDENNELTATVAALTTTDADAGDGHTYSLVAGTGDTDNASFTIDGTSLRANNISFNFEDRASYSLRLRTDDSKGGIYEEAFTFTINDVNEVPAMLSLSNSNIDEDDNAQTVGDFSTLDQDGGDNFTYTLVAGTGDDDNAEFTISGSTLSTAGLINFEEGATRSILVRVTDSGGLSIDQQFTITIGEVVIEPLRQYEANIPGGAVRNIFSPNGDGVNETWVIEDLLDNPVNEVKVYAQGGKLIFSQVNYQNDWDGTFKGDPIPDGTYYYEINVYDGERIIKGFLTIIRNR